MKKRKGILKKSLNCLEKTVSMKLNLSHRLKFSISLQTGGVNLWNFKIKILYEFTQFEISKLYDIGLQRYRDWKFRVCDKDTIPL